MKSMRKGWKKLMLGLWALGSCVNIWAQAVSVDSISIVSLMEQVEKATSYKIYTNTYLLDTPLSLFFFFY